MDDVTLYRIDATKHMWRFYRLDLQPDLFGLWVLVKEWGRIGRPGQLRITSFPTIDDAQHAFDRQRRIKEKRGHLAGASSARSTVSHSDDFEAFRMTRHGPPSAGLYDRPLTNCWRCLLRYREA